MTNELVLQMPRQLSSFSRRFLFLYSNGSWDPCGYANDCFSLALYSNHSVATKFHGIVVNQTDRHSRNILFSHPKIPKSQAKLRYVHLFRLFICFPFSIRIVSLVITF